MTTSTGNRLDGIELLRSLNDQERRDVEIRCRWRRCGKDEQIVDKDSEDRDVYFVVEGGVQIVNYSLSGREIAFARVSAGGFFGELSAIDGLPRSASVVTTEPSLLATVSPRHFSDIVTTHPEMAADVLRRLAAIIRTCDERIMDLSTLGAVQRVYQQLLRMAQQEDGDEAWQIRGLPTHKAIASLASTTRETVARSMSQLATAGIVERRGRTLQIHDRDTLERLAGAFDDLEEGLSR